MNPETIPFSQGALVVTSISAPNAVLKSLAAGCASNSARFIVTGDTKSPDNFDLAGCEYLDITAQRELEFSYASICPEKSYTRKNVAYLHAIKGGAMFIVETDDDNFPREPFWEPRCAEIEGDITNTSGWTNAYSWFSDDFIYPRGFPLTIARSPDANARDRTPAGLTYCPIQQGLADENPDVDAVYRMLFPLPFDFNQNTPLLLGKGQWCPFNSQNTTFFPPAYPLLYLPAHCSFRMTDIWRSFVAQRICWEYGWRIAFHSATVYQERNEHCLLKDFEDEISGYLQNQKIITALDKVQLSSDPADIGENLTDCYYALIELGVIGANEKVLLQAWLKDLSSMA